MGKLTEKGIVGLVGPVVFYEMNGKNYVRSKPVRRSKNKNIEQNENTNIFGIISTHGSGMITEMKNHLLFSFNRKTYNQARGWIYNEYRANYLKDSWDLSAQNHSMCQLNEEVDLRDFCKTGFEINDQLGGKITISFPSFNPVEKIKIPPRTKKIRIRMLVVTSDFKNKNTIHQYGGEYIFGYKNEPLPPKEFQLNTTGTTGDIAIVVIAIEYATTDWQGDRYLNGLNCLPAAIVSIGRLK